MQIWSGRSPRTSDTACDYVQFPHEPWQKVVILRAIHQLDTADDALHGNQARVEIVWLTHLPLHATGTAWCNRIVGEIEVSQRWALRQHSRKPCIAEATMLPLQCKASRSAGEVAATCLTAWQLEGADVASGLSML